LINENSTGKNAALGSSGIAFLSDGYLNNLNPASYSGIDSLSFMMDLGIYGGYTNYESRNLNKSKIVANLSYFAFGFRINKWFASSFGIIPYSTVRYDINTENTLDGIPEIIDVTSTGEGGINKFYWGNSLRLNKYLSFGINATYIKGTILQKEIISDNNYISGYVSQSTQYVNNLMLDYGALLTIGINNSNLRLGVIYNKEKQLNTTSDFYYTSSYDTLELLAKKSSYSIPENLGIGLSFEHNNIFKIGFDYKKSNWSKINYNFSSIRARDSEKFSFGLEISPKNKHSFSFRNLDYRIGGFYKKSYLVIHDKPLDSKALTAGIGIPLNRKISKINLAIEIGQYGTLSKGLIKERYGMLHLDISLHDIWFQKRKYN
jgi:hypothetical protein